MDTLAPDSRLPGLYLTMQVDMLTAEALWVLNKERVRDNRSLYKKRERIEKDVAGLIKDRGIIWFTPLTRIIHDGRPVRTNIFQVIGQSAEGQGMRMEEDLENLRLGLEKLNSSS